MAETDRTRMTLPVICSFWHGRLSWLERLCIASFIDRGHRFELYAYDRPDRIPAGCTLRDAGEVLPRERMFLYKGSRTPAVFADLFRLELMAREAGIWADCDVFCVRPFAGLAEYVFGIERGPAVNNAVFRCPPQSELLRLLRAVFEPGAVPPGLPWWRALEVRVRRALGDPLPVEHMQFGATGPWPLNHYVRALGLTRFIQPREVFYPLRYGETTRLLAPGKGIGEVTRSRTLGIHIWRSALTGRGPGQLLRPQPGSVLYGEAQRLKVSLDIGE